MKTLILIRHAKSSWDEPGISDYDRSLNHRGLTDAPVMGARLASRLDASDLTLDVFLCSSARRASETARLLAPALGVSDEVMDWRRALYLASPDTMLNVIRSVPDQAVSAVLLAHNPGITELAEILTGQSIGNVPTCGVITLELPTSHWIDVGGRAELVDFDYPKRLQSQNSQE